MKGPERRRREEEKEDREKISISIKKENPCSTYSLFYKYLFILGNEWDLSMIFSYSFFFLFLFLISPLSLRLSIWASFLSLSRIREHTKPAYEINREACDDFRLCERYALVYGYNAAYNRYFRQRPGAKWDWKKFLSRAWCLVLYSLAVASLNYIDTYELLNCSLNVLVWLHSSFLPPVEK